MIGAVLRVVLDDKDRGARPELRLAHRLDQHANGEVIVRDMRDGRRLAGARAARVIIRQPHDLQPRHLPLLFKSLKLGNETRRALHVGIAHVERVILGVNVPLEPLHLRLAGLAVFWARRELAVAAVAHTMRRRTIPQIAARWRRDREHALGRIRKLRAAVAVADRPRLLDEVRRVRRHAPFVPVGAHLALHVKIIERHEIARERMVVRRHVLAENAQRRIAVALAEIAEHLIESAVLLDDVDHVFDRRRIADLARDWIPFQLRRLDFPRRLRHARVGDPALLLQLCGQLILLGRQLHDADRARQDSADVFPHTHGHLLVFRRHKVAVCTAHAPLAVCDEQLPALRGAHARGIPSARDKAERTRVAGLLDFEDGHGVDVRIRDEKPLTIWRNRKRVRRVSRRRVGREFRDERLDGLAAHDINHGDRVTVRIRDKKMRAVLREHHLVRMLLRLPPRDLLPLLRINDGHMRLRPEAHVEAFAPLIEHARVRERRVLARRVEDRLGALRDARVVRRREHARHGRADLIRRSEREIVHIRRAIGTEAHSAHRLAPHICDVDHRAVAGNREAARHAALRLRAQRQRGRIAKVAVLEFENMQHLVA